MAIGAAILSRESKLFRRWIGRLKTRYPKLGTQIDAVEQRAHGIIERISKKFGRGR